MISHNKRIHFNLGHFLLTSICSFLLIGALWGVCAILQMIGCPFPKIEINKFSELAFFSLSNFSFITFLAMIPFQTAEEKLSPGFYARIVKRPWSHFGLYVLMSCFLVSLLVLSMYEKHHSESMLSQLFIAITCSVIFAVIFHRNQTLRYLYQPIIVYENLKQLAKEESRDELWLDLYECTSKAIKDHRISDARDFSNIMAKIYVQVSETEKKTNFQKGLQSLYYASLSQHPIASHMEKNWPFLIDSRR